jgi:nucleoside-diphosphate-sugar epimerase
MVTGGTGFIGRHLVGALAGLGAEVRVLARDGSCIPGTWAEIEVCRGDLEHARDLGRCCRNIDTIFHAAGFAHAWKGDAAHRTSLHWRVNAEGTRRLLEGAVQAGVERFVFFSSVKAMGEGEGHCVDETWPKPPLTAYGKAKRAAEQWVLDTGRAHAMHVTNLRLAMVYGAGGRGNLQRMAAAIRRGVFPPLPEVSNQRSMVHVADVVQAALIAAIEPAANQQTYIVTDGRDYSGREIYRAICRALGKPPPRWAVPAGLLVTMAKMGDLAGRFTGRSMGFDSETLAKLLGWACFDSDKIRRELGYEPTRTLADSLGEILRERSLTDGSGS